jgi:hypothetical protein
MRLRKKKIINPRLQLRLVAAFLCTAALAVPIEAIFLNHTFSQVVDRMPNDGIRLMAEMPRFMRTNLLLTFALLAPVTLGIGILATFRIAGPLYKLEQFLRSVRDGRQIEPCRIRKADELHEFCALLNEVTAPLRERAATERKPDVATMLDSVRPALPAAEPKSEVARPPS